MVAQRESAGEKAGENTNVSNVLAPLFPGLAPWAIPRLRIIRWLLSPERIWRLSWK
jgi:hypothetical protein